MSKEQKAQQLIDIWNKFDDKGRVTWLQAFILKADTIKELKSVVNDVKAILEALDN